MIGPRLRDIREAGSGRPFGELCSSRLRGASWLSCPRRVAAGDRTLLPMLGTASIPGCVTSMAPMSPPRVIVVEDEIMIRLPVVSALEATDFEVIEAGHAGEALAILEREAVRVHVVFTDVHMPGPMDGLVLAHHVRRHWPSIGLLVASGRGNVDAGAMPEGSRFIPKPYHLDHVVHHIRELRALLN